VTRGAATRRGWVPLGPLAVAVTLLAPAVGGCAILPGPLALTVTQEDLTPESPPNAFKTVRVIVTNAAAGTVRGITVRDTMPSGFTYVSTKAVSGEAIRTQTNDPAVNSPAPVWSQWSLPGGTSDKPAKLQLDFVTAVGGTPAKTPNFVQVTTNDTDPLSAKPILLSSQPTAVVDLSVSARSPVKPNETTHYTISLRNNGGATAKGTVVSAALPSGFIYAGTTELGGNAFRVGVTDPIANSVLPAWGTWEIPAIQEGGVAGVLRIAFDVKVIGSQAPGNYPISVTVTYNGLPAQTVADQAQVTVIK
jgi:uncharacterized repeat protein (TIGR01451 family)